MGLEFPSRPYGFSSSLPILSLLLSYMNEKCLRRLQLRNIPHYLVTLYISICK